MIKITITKKYAQQTFLILFNPLAYKQLDFSSFIDTRIANIIPPRRRSETDNGEKEESSHVKRTKAILLWKKHKVLEILANRVNISARIVLECAS